MAEERESDKHVWPEEMNLAPGDAVRCQCGLSIVTYTDDGLKVTTEVLKEFQTNAIMLNVSKEMYGDMAARPIGNLVFPLVGAKKTPAQQREEEVRVAKAKQAAADRITQARIKHGIVIAHYAENTPVLEVLALHQPVQGEGYWESTVCAGCDYAGYEAEPTEYPCRTTMVLTVLAGIEFA